MDGSERRWALQLREGRMASWTGDQLGEVRAVPLVGLLATGLVTGVGPLVPGNVARLAEPQWTHRASVGLLACVGPLVRRNRVLLAEALWAYRASVGLLASVGPLVPRNTALLSEAL